MTSATTCLWLPRSDARAAIDLWTHLVPDTQLVRGQTFTNPAGEERSSDVYTVRIAGREFQVMGAHGATELGMGMSMWLEVDDQQTLDRVWDGFLAAGGRELACGWIVDPFGVHWQVLPRSFRSLTDPADPQRAQRVVEQVWQMTRVDFDALERAAQG